MIKLPKDFKKGKQYLLLHWRDDNYCIYGGYRDKEYKILVTFYTMKVCSHTTHEYVEFYPYGNPAHAKSFDQAVKNLEKVGREFNLTLF